MNAAEQVRFWELYSQLAPVLLLALAIEARVIARFLEGAAELLTPRERLTAIAFVLIPLAGLGIFEMHAISVVAGGATWPAARVLGFYTAVGAVSVFLAICCFDILGRSVPEALVRVLNPGIVPAFRRGRLWLVGRGERWWARRTHRFVRWIVTNEDPNSRTSIRMRSMLQRHMARAGVLTNRPLRSTDDVYTLMLILRGHDLDHEALARDLRPLRRAEMKRRKSDEMRRLVTMVFR